MFAFAAFLRTEDDYKRRLYFYGNAVVGTWIEPVENETYEQMLIRLAYVIDTDPQLKEEYESRARTVRATQVDFEFKYN